jgi:hypothetical protein
VRYENQRCEKNANRNPYIEQRVEAVVAGDSMGKTSLKITLCTTNLINENKTDPMTFPFYEKMIKVKPAIITGEEANKITRIIEGGISISYKRDSEFPDRRDLFDSFTIKALFKRGDEVKRHEAEESVDYFTQEIIKIIREIESRYA